MWVAASPAWELHGVQLMMEQRDNRAPSARQRQEESRRRKRSTICTSPRFWAEERHRVSEFKEESISALLLRRWWKKKLWCRYIFFSPSWTDLTVIYQLPSTMILILYYHFGRVPRSCCSYLDILVSANVQRLQTHSAPDVRERMWCYCWESIGQIHHVVMLL